ncbi:MAG: lysozyme inhibitor LprI family protein [Alphaproteobacteria bacterium]
MLLAVLLAAGLAAHPAEAEMFGPAYSPCGDRPDTFAIVACVQAKTKAADRRLNAAYKALQARIDPSQRQPLLAAQRLWVQYRDANCEFYGAQEGTIRQIQAAECLRAMTDDRARELEQAMKFE